MKVPPGLRRALAALRPWAIGFGFAGAVALAAAAPVADRIAGRTVLPIVPWDEKQVEVNRSIFLDGDPVAEIYGTPKSGTVRVLFVDEARLLRPVEDSSLLLLKIDPGAGDTALQLQTFALLTRLAAGGFFALFLVGLFLPKKSPA